MILAPPGRGRRERRRPKLASALLALAGGALLFALGVGLGMTLEESRVPGGTRTNVRTLEPLTLVPAPETVTVTVTAP